ncbi:MAG: hypothetical protein MJ193_04805 [Clostridia bacterium]|nr:hypothetical protein [Clostridia bacterium]
MSTVKPSNIMLVATYGAMEIAPATAVINDGKFFFAFAKQRHKITRTTGGKHRCRIVHQFLINATPAMINNGVFTSRFCREYVRPASSPISSASPNFSFDANNNINTN